MAPRPKKQQPGAVEFRDALRFDWQARAACRGMDPEVFFDTADRGTGLASKTCAGCPVRIECLGYALAAGERYGIWGGVTENGRSRMPRDERERIVARAARAA